MVYPGAHALSDPDRVAVHVVPEGGSLTYGELDAGANRLANLVAGLGVSPRDTVLVCLPNCARYFEILWGLHYSGVVYTAVSTRTTAAELSYFVDDAEPALVIVDESTIEVAEEALTRAAHTPRHVLCLGERTGTFASYEEAVSSASPEPRAGRVIGIDMLYSSGTTGRPKGVVRPHDLLPVETYKSPVTEVSEEFFGFADGMVYLSPAPMYHAAPMRFGMAVHSVGGTVVMMQRFDAAEFLAAVETFGVTHTQVVPTMFVRLLRLPDDVRSRFDLTSLRYVIHAAAPCPVDVKRAMFDWLGPVIHEHYSGTEANGFVYCSPEEWLDHPGSVGRPRGCQLHIVGEDGMELGSGEIGTVYFEGGRTFEYKHDARKTVDSRHEAGWSTLGDIGYLDDDGFLYLTDRKSNMIISGGVNIAPQEAENRLISHPAVYDAAVIGVPDSELGQVVKAVVQPATMPASDDERVRLEAELIEFCREELARYKCPRSIDFRSELPRLPTGKLLKRLLVEEYA